MIALVVVCGVLAVSAIVAFELSSRKNAATRVAETTEWANRAVTDARKDAADTRAWFSDELRNAREENARLTRMIESRNLAEFTSAEDQLARTRGTRAPEKKPEPGALQEMWAGKPPLDDGRKGQP